VTLTPPSEEARSYYQQRLALTYLVGFALAAAFLVGNVVAATIVEGDPRAPLPSRVFHVAAIAVLGSIAWWLRRGKVRFALLELVDTVVILFISLLLDFNAGLYPMRSVSVFNLALVTGLVAIVRAVVVPSTARRTLVLGVLASLVAFAVFFLSAFHPAWPVVQRADPEWPLPYQLAAFSLWLGACIATATVASRVIYRLRREVRSARQLGQYVLGERLGEGGMGVVHRATHALLRRETAIKLLPPGCMGDAAIRRFEREVIETARLRHPNTVAIYDYGRTPDGVFYYAMEYLDGLTLSGLVELEGALPPGRVVWLLAQVCASLEEAHSIGLVHRDVKPGNVMVTGNTAAWDHVKVLDFGLVKSRAPLDGGASLSSPDQLTGTPLYMAPEAIAHPEDADARSDLYAVAALGYYVLSGRHVFAGSAVELLAAHLHTAPRPPREVLGRDLPEDLEALLLRGLAKSPADRPQSAAAFREALLRCDVPPWTQADARAWWRTRGERALQRDERGARPAYPPTVSVVVERAVNG
jgi:serine/threonine-protein kinase